MRRRWTRLSAVSAVLLSIGLQTSGAVAGPPWPYPPSPVDTGSVGVHDLVDTGEAPNVRCRYAQSGALTSLRIRRPIAFARNATGGTDSQRIRWHWEVMGYSPGDSYTPHRLTQGTSSKVLATDGRNAQLGAVVVPLTLTDEVIVRVRHTIDWFKPSDPSVRVGRAVHWAQRYEVNGWAQSTEVDWCYTTVPKTLTPTTPPGHSGAYGTHLIVDSAEYPGVRCIYASTPPYRLIRIEPNVAIAFNTSPARESIRRRLVIQYTDSTTEPRSWVTLRITDPVSRTATNESDAVFPRASFAVVDGQDHVGWRVVQRLLWSTPSGRADETAQYSFQRYAIDLIGGPICPGAD